MIIKTLVENTALSDAFAKEHGLSLYIETKKHKVLFDLGQGERFVGNAQKLAVDLAAVDIVVISHGHSDHGGGLRKFLQLNSQAKVYLQRRAFAKHYSHKAVGENVEIGLDETLLPNERFVFVDDYLVIDDEIELFANVKAAKFVPSDNKDLLMEVGGGLAMDDFAHEQNMILSEAAVSVLVEGCAHKGIVNILEQFHEMKHRFPSHVIGGFHLSSSSRHRSEDPAVIRQIGEYLQAAEAKIYTCHCTGPEPFRILKDVLGERIEYLASGSQLTI